MQVRAQARPTARGPLNPRLDGIYPEQDPRHSVYLRRSSSSPRVSCAPSRIVSSWFVCCPGDVTNMRPVDITVEVFPEDAASLRFSMIRQQTILCATRIEAGTRLLYGGYTRGKTVMSGLRNSRSPAYWSQRENKDRGETQSWVRCSASSWRRDEFHTE